jgi:hypothetical protein
LNDDGVFGTEDDAKIFTVSRDLSATRSSIGSFIVKGQAYGTAGLGDMFGVVAEQIGKAKVGGRTFAFTKTGNEAFFAAPTLGGLGAENPMFDFTIRELGSTTPTGTVAAGVDFKLSPDFKTATFNDVDGDIVTVKRTSGNFDLSNFMITPKASGGGLLTSLTVNPSLDGKPVGLSITAKPGPSGGNGFVNVGEITADQTDLGIVVIGGELQDLDTGNSDPVKPGLGSLTVHSLGALAGTAPFGDEINSKHGIGTITVKTDVRHFHIFANSSDTGNLGSLTVGGSMIVGEVQAAANIGTIKIGGSFLGGQKIQATKRIGTISVGGDFNGNVEAFAQGGGSATGADIVLKSFTVNGSVEASKITLGRNNNADASIGAITVGRAWIASSVLAGTTAGVDTFIGTADDAKVTAGGPTDVAARFSSIASITIKGQALGSAAAGDSFGIVAEQIGSAKVGARVFKFDKGERDTADAFAVAPTGPGAGTTPLPFDFYIREVTTP